jgi:Cu+-exporting ATPase
MGPVRFRHLVQPVVVYEIVASVEEGEAMVDPVCRMQVDPAVDTVETTIDGRRYVFCSEECRAAFVSHPEDYVVR